MFNTLRRCINIYQIFRNFVECYWIQTKHVVLPYIIAVSLVLVYSVSHFYVFRLSCLNTLYQFVVHYFYIRHVRQTGGKISESADIECWYLNQICKKWVLKFCGVLMWPHSRERWILEKINPLGNFYICHLPPEDRKSDL